MKSVFLLQWQRFHREPVLVLAFLVLTIVFIAALAGGGPGQSMAVLVYPDDTLTEQEEKSWMDRLNDESGSLDFRLAEETEAREAVLSGDASMAVRLLEDDYRLLVAADDPNRYVLEGYLNRVYSEELRLRQAEQQGGSGVREEVAEFMEEPALSVTTSTPEAEGETFQYDGQLQLLFGMSLFFSIYTVMFSLMKIIEEKRGGTWDRLILSPLRKWQIYLGHLVYCFIVGFVQIVLVFLLFKYIFHFDVGNRFDLLLLVAACYTFSIVALSMLVMGLVNNPQQLQAVVPIVATGMAMIGGAFWPIEIVSNDILLAISKALPITYGLEALKDVAIYGRGLQELAEPLSIMLLIGVVCMGVGINLMERRAH